ncbi:hypothetical protein DPMN_105407 [Dreissena polymorpha]|uniref:Uncharacterized protein n=1 Tax=Dreissena polymorpha TaxID=45954 RepID=A0A9D4K0W9_DREPO|nr:hypothetical protein DPMN_105407 [Dreissena polymorpha]
MILGRGYNMFKKIGGGIMWMYNVRVWWSFCEGVYSVRYSVRVWWSFGVGTGDGLGKMRWGYNVVRGVYNGGGEGGVMWARIIKGSGIPETSPTYPFGNHRPSSHALRSGLEPGLPR